VSLPQTSLPCQTSEVFWPTDGDTWDNRGDMEKNRLEAFSDAVLAIVITIMVLELRAPVEANLSSLGELWPVFGAYVLSFVFLAIYWNNHHHMLAVTHRVNGAILWANMHLLFWLSLTPFVTSWMGETQFASLPTATYGVLLLLAAIAYYILQGRILALEGPDSVLARAVGSDWKGKISPVIYAVAIPFAFVHQAISGALYVVVALIWLIPDRRIERALAETEQTVDPTE
jgi:uncharacterized membrane protein